MQRAHGFLVGMTVLAAVACSSGSGAPPQGQAARFAIATVHFEQNATDGDVEVVFEAMGGNDGLTSLTVTAPDGRTVMSATSPDTSTMGLRQYRFESPEPTDIPRLQKAYPEGVYRFAGTTARGTRYNSEVTLTHRLPPGVTGVKPADEAQNVPVRGMRVSWTAVPDIASYSVLIEQPATGFELSVTLPRSATSFAVPDGVLRAGQSYTLSIGAVARGGNASFVETSFATAAATGN
jgi:hypothetical protein